MAQALERVRILSLEGNLEDAADLLEGAVERAAEAEDVESLRAVARTTEFVLDGATGPVFERLQIIWADAAGSALALSPDEPEFEEDVGEAGRPRWRTGIPVTTAPFLPGHEIVGYVGEVFGVIVRSRGGLPRVGASLKSVAGGEIRTMTNLLDRSRRDAVDRMVAEADARGADAIISMRFDANAIAEGWTEICAYGTAVLARKLSEGAHSPS